MNRLVRNAIGRAGGGQGKVFSSQRLIFRQIGFSRRAVARNQIEQHGPVLRVRGVGRFILLFPFGGSAAKRICCAGTVAGFEESGIACEQFRVGRRIPHGLRQHAARAGKIARIFQLLSAVQRLIGTQHRYAKSAAPKSTTPASNRNLEPTCMSPPSFQLRPESGSNGNALPVRFAVL